MVDARLIEALEHLPATPFAGTVWRHMFNDIPPDRVNTRGARWNPPGVAAIYASLERDTCIAEGQHAIDIQPLRPVAKRVVYECHLEADDVVDLTGNGILDRLGLSDPDVEDDDFTACQAIGEAAAWLGLGGVIVPSARAAGGNIVILVDANNRGPILEVIRYDVIFDPKRGAW
ncbi:MAG: RES family NAD+ phosphorylase [Actinobacteria bacterium]|nr:RES family NAD+ phosphorylase [Actinomycetota bacterium]